MVLRNANANSNTVRSGLPINLCSIRPAVCNLFCHFMFNIYKLQLLHEQDHTPHTIIQCGCRCWIL